MASIVGFIVFVIVARCIWTAGMIAKTIYDHREEKTPVE